MVYLFSLLAAGAFALGNVLQQKGTLEVDTPEGDPRFLAQVIHRPVWLAGCAIQCVGLVLQAAALDHGTVVVVQSLTTLSLVIALPLGAWITNQAITRRVIAGAVATVVGIALFLTVGNPQGGTSSAPPSTWWAAIIACAAVIALLLSVGHTRTGAGRALAFGAAAGVAFGLQAAATKVFVARIGQGAAMVLSSWSLYGLIVAGLGGFAFQQSALRTGVLAPAIASENCVTLLSSVVLGTAVLGESLGNGSDRLTPAIIGLGAAVLGIVLLAGARPPRGGPAAGAQPARGEAPGISPEPAGAGRSPQPWSPRPRI
jgi:drug/metabolite transporter (DMT)-like permease